MKLAFLFHHYYGPLFTQTILKKSFSAECKHDRKIKVHQSK